MSAAEKRSIGLLQSLSFLEIRKLCVWRWKPTCMHLLARQVVCPVQVITHCFTSIPEAFRREYNQLPKGTKETLAPRIGSTHYKTY